jgi:outer membrane protein assembly factor BamB
MACAVLGGLLASRLAVACAVLGGLLAPFMLGSVSEATVPPGPPAAADLWPTFGHDPLHSGVSPDTAIAASDASRLGKRWAASLGSTLNQPSPVVAYSAKLGKTLVYAVTYKGVVAAFDAKTGSLVWRRSLATKVASSPTLSADTLYIGGLNGTLRALNAATGAIRCSFTLPVVAPAAAPGRLMSSPVVGNVDGTGPTLFIGDAGSEESNNGGHFWAITGVGNSAGGCRERWMYDDWPNKGTSSTLTGVWDEPALAQNGHGTWEVLFGTSNPDQSVYALDAANGSLLWRFHTLNRGSDEDVGAGPTVAPPGSDGFAGGAVYVDGKDGIEYALNLRTGKRIWSFTLGPGSDHAYGVSEAALTGNELVVCYAASVFVLNAKTGAKRWRTTPGADIQASPAIAGPKGHQVLFVGDVKGREYGLLLRSGAQVFAAATNSRLQASAAVAAGMLYFISAGKVYAYAPK